MNDDLPRAGAAPLPVLPCPFCGEKLVQLGDYNHEGGLNWWQHPLDDDLNTAGNCIAKGIKLDVNWYGPSKGIIAWNHRAAADVAGEKAGLIQAARSDARPSSSPSPAVRDGAIRECVQAVGQSAWKHVGDDAYSQGMDRGASHQLSESLRALDALKSAPSVPSPTGTEAALDEAKRHLAILTKFWMDNDRWHGASEAARAFIGGVPISPLSPPEGGKP